jgi:hypothetical protein
LNVDGRLTPTWCVTLPHVPASNNTVSYQRVA